MVARSTLRLVFGFILISMIAVTSWASIRQPVWEWGGLTQAPDNAWTIATPFDDYYGFITFSVSLVYKETRWLPPVPPLPASLVLGNMAMSGYVLWQLRKLPLNAPMATLLTARNA